MKVLVLGVASVTGMVTAVTTAVAQAAGSGGSDLAPYLSGGSSAVAVAGLAYVVRKALAGDIVAKPVAEYQREQAIMLAAAGDREATAMHLAEQYHQDRALYDKTIERLEKQQAATNRLMWRIESRLGGTDDRNDPRRP